jgi:glycosyltransferase involved in cell wall biosynthesis
MVISEAPPVKSGVARVASKLSAGLKGRGHQVDIISLNDIPRYERGEIRLSSMPLKLNELKKEFHRYDIINLHGPVPTFSDVFLLWGLRGMKRPRPKLIYTHHAPVDLGASLLWPFIKVYNFLQEKLSNLADHVVVSTPEYKQRLSRHVPAEKLSAIPWGVDFDRYYAPIGKKPDPFTVLFLGQIRPYKGLGVLLEAVTRMEQTRLWVIGDGHYAERYRRKADQKGLSQVTFYGHLSDPRVLERLKQAHAIVLPSVTHSEAFGIVLLEGMAAGLVPVASHLPGVADVVGNEGFTFPPGDFSALRDILTRLRDDRLLRLHMAKLAQERARLYPWSRTVFEYDRVFSQTVSEIAWRRGWSTSEIPTHPFVQGQ